MNKLIEILQDNSGGASSTRVILLVCFIGVVAVWAGLSIKAGSMQPIPDGITTILGIVMSGKVIQRFGEKPEGTPGA